MLFQSISIGIADEEIRLVSDEMLDQTESEILRIMDDDGRLEWEIRIAKSQILDSFRAGEDQYALTVMDSNIDPYRKFWRYRELFLEFRRMCHARQRLNQIMEEELSKIQEEERRRETELGESLLEEGRMELAIKHFDEAKKNLGGSERIQNGLLEAYIALGEAALETDRLNQAFEYYQKAQEINPTDSAILSKIGSLHILSSYDALENDDLESAWTSILLAKDCVGEIPSKHDAHFKEVRERWGGGLAAEGRRQMSIGEKKTALSFFERADDVYGDSDEERMLASEIEALRLEVATQEKIESADRLVADGRVALSLPMYREAFSLLEANTELKRKYVSALCSLASQYREDGEFELAVELYDEALSIVPEDRLVQASRENTLDLIKENEKQARNRKIKKFLGEYIVPALVLVVALAVKQM